MRIVTRLERHYADFDGLNLTWETLEGVVKHNGPLIGGNKKIEDLPAAFNAYEAGLKRRGDLTQWIEETALTGWQAEHRTTGGGFDHIRRLFFVEVNIVEANVLFFIRRTK